MERGRNRRRGLSGGGTLWSGALQLLQSSPPESPARSQWPRARHSGLIHCTVQPGKYCTFLPPVERRATFSTLAPWTRNDAEWLQGFCGESLGVSSSNIQSLVVGLRRHI